jgi:diguanylate cyclase (GGDEF)-like protein/PAS domain S-box-containing protein
MDEVMSELESSSHEKVQAEIAQVSVARTPYAILPVLAWFCVVLAAVGNDVFNSSIAINTSLLLCLIAGRIGAGVYLIRKVACLNSTDIALYHHRFSSVFRITDGCIWLFSAWILLSASLVSVEDLLPAGLVLAATMAFINIYDWRASIITTLIILGASVLITIMYGSPPTMTASVLVLAMFASLAIGLYHLRKTLVDTITEKYHHEALARQEKETNYVFNQHWQNTPLAAIEWDMRFRITSWNPSAENIFGYKAQEAIGKPLDLLFEQTELDKIKRTWRSLWRRKVGLRSIHRCKNKNGQIVHCEWHDAAIMRSGQAIGISSFVDDVTQQAKAEQMIKKQANYDSLTNLPNRRFMMEELKRSILRCKRNKNVSALVFMDLDHFKDINDTQGHEVGDIVLKAFAERVKSHIRGNDMVARFGGDEFVVLLENVGKNPVEAAQNAKAVTDKLLHAGIDLCSIGDIQYDLDVSGGIVIFNGDWDENEILKKADLAMYRVKKGGRKGMAFYDESLSIETEYRVELIRGLRHGLENEEFDLHYQPIVNEKSRVVYSEALLRWHRSPNNTVAAGHFIEIMSDSPMMSTVGYWIIDRVCQDIQKLKKEHAWLEGQAIFVNISPKQLMDVNFARKVRLIIESNQIDPENVVFEITEESLIHNYDEVLQQLKELLSIGIRIALDDFGTGYSSLAMLKDLPVHFVKLDKEFVQSLFQNKHNSQIVNAIIKLCEILGLKVIAEGVEKETQFDALQKMSCDYYQGFMFHKPMLLEHLMGVIKGDSNFRKETGRSLSDHLRLVE